ncbi:MAG: ABC transporter ATP-binding protein [Candidatus Coatesbacteria bacterium]
MSDRPETPATPVSETTFFGGIPGYLRQTAGQLTLGSVAGILTNTLVVLPAVLLGRAIDAVVAWEGGRSDARAAGWAIATYAGGVLLTEGPRIGKRWWLRTANTNIRTNMRADAVRGILGWPLGRLHGVSVGDLMARIIGDVEVVGRGVREITVETWDTILLSTSLIVTMVWYNPHLTAVALLPVPAAMVLAHATGRWVRGRTTAAREANSALTATLQEQLAGGRVLRLFGRSSAAVERIRSHADAQARANLAVVRLQAGLAPVYSTVMMGGVILVVWRGGRDVIAGAMTVGAFVAYLQLFLRFVGRGARIPRLLNSVQSAGAAWTRLRPLLAPPVPPSGLPRWSTFRPGHIAGEEDVPVRPAVAVTRPVAVALESVTFRYPDAASPALRGVSLAIPAGAFVAVTGPVGSGKTAIARAVLGLYPPEAGRVLLDGVSIDRIPPTHRAARCGYLPQEAGLFSGTIRENLLMALPGDGPAGDETVRRAVGCAALEEDLAGFPDGLDTEIGETGIRLSGGQRQRVALARALAASLPGTPGLLVLDDPFSAVDVETETLIIRRLRDEYGPGAPEDRRATILLLSHRLAAFPLADLVVVVRAGEVEETGTHDALLNAGGLYARIFRAQTRTRLQPPAGGTS